ncbi:MAG: type IV pilin protein [Nitrospiraceae bacterium]
MHKAIRHLAVSAQRGFTLMELMLVVCVLGILVSVATLSYKVFLDKAKEVEGEAVVHEVDRLEQMYHSQYHAYTVDQTALGLAMAGPLKHYTVDIRLGSAKSTIGYLARAIPAGSTATDSWMLVAYRDGTTSLDRLPPETSGAPFANSNLVIEADGTISLSGGADQGSDSAGYASSPFRCQECGRTVILRGPNGR